MEVIKQITVEDLTQLNMMDYAAYVLLSRALPDLRDGFKPSYRMVLETMRTLNIIQNTKSANVAGAVMKIHPHGSTYGTIVGMVQKDNNIPLIIGKGNFGAYTCKDIQAAADRYTEIRLSKRTPDLFFRNIKNNTNFIPSYDGTEVIPDVLPAILPNILLTAQSGIAVGFANSMPSFNQDEVCKAVIEFIENGKLLNPLIPDFQTGGFIIDDKEIFDKINNSGSGSVRLRAKAAIDKNTITINEIPYSTTVEAIVEKIIVLVKAGKLPEISDVNNLTGIKGISIEIDAKRGTDMEKLLEKLYRSTPLEGSYSSNMNILHNGLPKVMGVYEIIEQWIEWRQTIIQKEISHLIKTSKIELHTLRGFRKIVVDIEKVIEIIRFSKDINSDLIKSFDLDEIQAEYISNMKLKRLNSDKIIIKLEEIKVLEDDVIRLERMTSSDYNKTIIEDMNMIISKYSMPRRTILIDKVEQTASEKKEIRIKEKEPIISYPVTLFCTKAGYIFKGHSELEINMKPGDEVILKIDTNNSSTICAFTSTDEVIRTKISDLESDTSKTIGTLLKNEDKVLDIIGYAIDDDLSMYKDFLIIYSKGYVSKISSKTIGGSRKLLQKSCKHILEPISIIPIKNDVVLIINDGKKQIEFNTSSLESAGTRLSPGKKVSNQIISFEVK